MASIGKKISSISVTSTEQKLDLALDFGGYNSLIVEGTADFQLSVNDNASYITYKANNRYIVPGPVYEIFIKTATTATVNYWAFDTPIIML